MRYEPARAGGASLSAGYRKDGVSRTLAFLTRAGAVITALSALGIVVYIVVTGIPGLSADLFSIHYNSDNVSLFPALINTLFIAAISLVIATPLGIFAAVFLTEYARRDSRVVRVIRLTAETLSGIPSIVYGLFGYLFFVIRLGWGYSVLAGSVTLSIMILPLVMRTAEEAILSVPQELREGSFSLGAGRLRTVMRIVLPSAVPGILAGVILAIGRVVGETAALIYTAGTIPDVSSGLTNSGRSLAVHMYTLANEGLHTRESAATALVLLILVAGINALSAIIAKKVGRK